MHTKVLPVRSSADPVSARQDTTPPTGYLLPSDRSVRGALWVALAIVVFMLLVSASAVAVLVSGGSPETTTAAGEQSPTAQAPGSTPRASEQFVVVESPDTTIPASEQFVVVEALGTTADVKASVADGVEDPAHLLLAFGKAWRDGDWETMQTLASRDVVTMAQDWYDRGSYPNVTSDDVEPILDTCFFTVGEGTRCDFTDAPLEGSGFVFGLTYIEGRAGSTIIELTPVGDAD